MSKKKVIEKICKEDSWGRKYVPEEILNEMRSAAYEEGCEWGDVAPAVIDLYIRVSSHSDYFSEKLQKALFDEMINFYMFIEENTEVVEYPEKEVITKVAAKKVREWIW